MIKHLGYCYRKAVAGFIFFSKTLLMLIICCLLGAATEAMTGWSIAANLIVFCSTPLAFALVFETDEFLDFLKAHYAPV